MIGFTSVIAVNTDTLDYKRLLCHGEGGSQAVLGREAGMAEEGRLGIERADGTECPELCKLAVASFERRGLAVVSVAPR